jgi:hypothetical protein
MATNDWKHWMFSGHNALSGLERHFHSSECKVPQKYRELWMHQWEYAYDLTRDKPLAAFLLLRTTRNETDGRVLSYYSLWSYDGGRMNFLESDCPYVGGCTDDDEGYVATQFVGLKGTIAVLNFQKNRFPQSSVCGGRLSPGLGIGI